MLLILFSICTRVVVLLQVLWPSQFTQTWPKRFRGRRHFDEGSCRYPRTLYHCELPLSLHSFGHFRCQIVLYIILYSTEISRYFYVSYLINCFWHLSVNMFIPAHIQFTTNVCRSRVYRLMQTIVHCQYYWKAPFLGQRLTPSSQDPKWL